MEDEEKQEMPSKRRKTGLREGMNLREAKTKLMDRKRTSNDSSQSNDSSIQSVEADIIGISKDKS